SNHRKRATRAPLVRNHNSDPASQHAATTACHEGSAHVSTGSFVAVAGTGAIEVANSGSPGDCSAADSSESSAATTDPSTGAAAPAYTGAPFSAEALPGTGISATRGCIGESAGVAQDSISALTSSG